LKKVTVQRVFLVLVLMLVLVLEELFGFK